MAFADAGVDFDARLELAASNGGIDHPAMLTLVAVGENKTKRAFTAFFDLFLTNREELVANNAEIFYLGWRIGDLVSDTLGGISVPGKDWMQREWYSKYAPQIEVMEKRYRTETVKRVKSGETFARQREYLTNNTPYNFSSFTEVFSGLNEYSKEQAAELLPLLEAYQSNYLATVAPSETNKWKPSTMTNSVANIIKRANRALNPSLARFARASATNSAPVVPRRPKNEIA